MYIAVVIVSYKSAKLAIDCLASIHADSRNAALGVRAVVVDNASGDFPAIEDAIAQHKWNWVTLIQTPRNGGFAYGNNRGIECACLDGPPNYIYLLNPDVLVRKDAIGSLVDFMETHPKAGIAGGSFENLDGSEWLTAFRFPTLQSELISGLQWGLATNVLRRWEVAMKMSNVSQRVDWICGAAMLIRPEVLTALGGLDENYFLYFEETDFCRRACQAGYESWYVPESRVMHIRGQSTAVTDESKGATRLPAYWFASRRRFFVTCYGMRRAMIIDLVALLANMVGMVKRIALGRSRSAVPNYVRDLLAHSVLWARNRRQATSVDTPAAEN
jgi:GT2 family glycosyltransferase